MELNKQKKEELIEKNKIINQYIRVLNALEMERNLWLNKTLKEMGLDTSKRAYKVSPDGKIKNKVIISSKC